MDIENEKVDIESVLSEKGSNFSVKTTVHIHDSPQQGGCDLGIYLNPSSIGFKRSLNSEIYVDKTGLIEKTNVLLDTEQKFICVSRPRRFGKSMAVNMLSAYYACDEDSSALFDGLTISHTASYSQHLNQYNVIKVNMQDFLSMTHSMDGMLTMLKKYLVMELIRSFPNTAFLDKNNLIQMMRDIYAETNRSLLWAGDADAVAKGIDRAHEDISILQYNNENALSCTINLAFYFAREYYTIVRELPTGKGFADICFIPRKLHLDKPAAIIELKWDKSATGTLAQIKEEHYTAALHDYAGDLLLVGINYNRDAKKHECVIEKVQKTS